jgi:hypothetical protein
MLAKPQLSRLTAPARRLDDRKSTRKISGRNSRVSGQGFIAPPPHIWDDYFIYLKALTAGLGFPVFEMKKPVTKRSILYRRKQQESEMVRGYGH